MDARNLDGNIFSVVGRVQATLRSAGLRSEAQEVFAEVQQAGSYDAAMSVCMKYVNFEFGAVSNVRRTDDSNKLPAGKYIVSDPQYCGECGELVSYCGGEHEDEDNDYEDEE
jgi:hypothetical protein